MSAFWCEHAVLAGGPRRHVRVVTAGGRLTEVRPGATAQPGDVVLRGLVLPGLANAHSHVFHRALRGRTQGDGGNFWTWREGMYALADRLDPDSYRTLATAVFAEMVLAGYTVVGEFHYLHHGPGGRPYDDPNAMGRALAEAAQAAGIRLTLLDTLYLAGGLTGGGHRPLDATQERFSDGSAQAWGERASVLRADDRCRVGAAVHSVRAVPAGDLAVLAEVAGGHGWPVHAHVSEQPGENLACQSFYGRTPVRLLADEGLLTAATSLVHATHLEDEDVGLVGRAGATAVLCPTTERDLADGIGPARRLVDAGARVAVGSDEHAVVDPFEELRGVEMHERLATLERGRFAPGELLAAGAADGYRSLGWPEGGRLVEGGLADLVAVRTDSPRTAGCALDQLLYAATAADVTDVVVGGEHVVADGQHRVGDVGRLLAEAISAVRR
ncbi:formimidoylglutamate deiminase [Phycicoccus endophyticus]|uniref:Formimidoylglutamate deiminase n=1 Tax=Phycicoccus endophyticus TaxID=1690220 RepID=A0A7G9R0A9_9MICO|nr:formimidoylglutamate deiminase [Phycicoccus endophyticus]NHI20159.1 formimidoylglutamate deiminase [Phycicoccus endophyticus]QNN49034.1 formimidoylglutamate deiminase [Phycicoccus endophyticus]GGL37941.1 formimidoylglutamate deiminase [Phycicoccus endophyticus]